MDIITKGDFAISKRRGGAVFSFVIPSSETTVDYVEALQVHIADVQRM
jgi:hypothetical protein